MVDEYNRISKDDLEESLETLEVQISSVSHTMVVLMSSLERMIEPFGEFDVGYSGKHEDK
jgi:chaperonin cofactor prefoldin